MFSICVGDHQTSTFRTQRDAGYQTTNPYGHMPAVVKRAVIGSKGGWKLSTIFLSCKVLHDWSIIKLRRVYLCWGVSQNVPSQTPPNWSKRPQHTKTRLVKRPHFEKTLQTGQLPSDWKRHKFVPYSKKATKQNLLTIGPFL